MLGTRGTTLQEVKSLGSLPSTTIRLDKFLKDFWDYYRELLAYRDAPSSSGAAKLQAEFYRLFNSNTGYQELDERKRLTVAKISELLLVLDHPELPLHNNPAELGARTMVQRRNISYATQTLEGTKAWDIFMSLVATTRKLGISFFEYMRDRISQLGNIPSLATLIREQSSFHSLMVRGFPNNYLSPKILRGYNDAILSTDVTSTDTLEFVIRDVCSKVGITDEQMEFDDYMRNQIVNGAVFKQDSTTPQSFISELQQIYNFFPDDQGDKIVWKHKTTPESEGVLVLTEDDLGAKEVDSEPLDPYELVIL